MVADYVEQSDRDSQQTAEVFGLLTGVLPFEPDAMLRVLDIGSGYGVCAAAVLDAFPRASAVGLDFSHAMMDVGRARMARFGERFRYQDGDFGDGHLPDDLIGPFDLVVSSRAIIHLSPDAKRRLFREVFERLAPGGCFMDHDNMRPRDPFLNERYLRLSRYPSPGREHPDPVAEQLAWLREAGFTHVDCFWKRLARALICTDPEM